MKLYHWTLKNGHSALRKMHQMWVLPGPDNIQILLTNLSLNSRIMLGASSPSHRLVIIISKHLVFCCTLQLYRPDIKQPTQGVHDTIRTGGNLTHVRCTGYYQNRRQSIPFPSLELLEVWPWMSITLYTNCKLQALVYDIPPAWRKVPEIEAWSGHQALSLSGPAPLCPPPSPITLFRIP